MERTPNGYRLTSGREIDAHHGLISIARKDDRFEIAEGYDGTIVEATGDAFDEADNWTVDERRELSEFMIAQWKAFANPARENIGYHASDCAKRSGQPCDCFAEQSAGGSAGGPNHGSDQR